VRFTRAAAISALIVFSMATESQSQRRQTAARTSLAEPGRSFAVIDRNLTTLSQKQAELSGGDASARAQATRSMKRALAAIQRACGRLEFIYERRHEPFGRRMFSRLKVRAQEVSRSLEASTGGASASAVHGRDLYGSVVSLVTQFQAASAGFSALRCEPGQFTCCSPKRREDLRPGESLACRWMCVGAATACHGFRGPRLIQR
jgi:hypothetical protein